MIKEETSKKEQKELLTQSNDAAARNVELSPQALVSKLKLQDFCKSFEEKNLFLKAEGFFDESFWLS